MLICKTKCIYSINPDNSQIWSDAIQRSFQIDIDNSSVTILPKIYYNFKCLSLSNLLVHPVDPVLLLKRNFIILFLLTKTITYNTNIMLMRNEMNFYWLVFNLTQVKDFYWRMFNLTQVKDFYWRVFNSTQVKDFYRRVFNSTQVKDFY